MYDYATALLAIYETNPAERRGDFVRRLPAGRQAQLRRFLISSIDMGSK